MNRRAVPVGLTALSALLSAGLAAGPAQAYWSASTATSATAVGASLAPPASGSISAVSTTSATVRVSGAPASGPGPSGYRVLRGGSAVCSTGSSLPATCTDTGLVPGTSYSYSVVSLVGSAPWVSHTGLALTAVTTAPAAPAKPDLATASDTGDSGSDDLTGDRTPTIGGGNGSAAAGATLSLYDNGSGSALASTTVAPDGSWSVDLPSLTDGAHSLTARVGYGSGTLSAASPALVVTVDGTAPTVTLTCPPAGTGHRNTFAGNQSDNGRMVTVTAVPTSGSTVSLTASNPSGGTYSVQSGNLQLTGGRSYNASSSQTDLAGNTGTSAVCTFNAG